MNIFELYEKLSSDGTLDKINTAISNFVKISIKIGEAYIAFSKWWEQAYPQICETIDLLESPGYTTYKKKELIERYKKWGEYGWTFSFNTKVATLSSTPISLEDADQKMLPYCTLENVSEIKRRLIESGINQADLEEAEFCFEHEKYKSSAIIIFALIDHELISKGFRNPPRKNQTEGNYKIGRSAISEYKKQNESAYENSVLFANLFFLNIIETLMTLFKDGNNFANEPDVINRNFIVHGMSNRTITAIDCFKVWSALYSLVIMLPQLEEISMGKRVDDGIEEMEQVNG